MKSIEFPREIDFWREVPELSRSEALLQLNVSIVTLMQIRDELVEDGTEDRL
jgi:hypothetical protein